MHVVGDPVLHCGQQPGSTLQLVGPPCWLQPERARGCWGLEALAVILDKQTLLRTCSRCTEQCLPIRTEGCRPNFHPCGASYPSWFSATILFCPVPAASCCNENGNRRCLHAAVVQVLHLPPNAPYYKAGGAPGQRQEAGRIDNARFGAVSVWGGPMGRQCVVRSGLPMED